MIIIRLKINKQIYKIFKNSQKVIKINQYQLNKNKKKYYFNKFLAIQLEMLIQNNFLNFQIKMKEIFIILIIYKNLLFVSKIKGNILKFWIFLFQYLKLKL